LFPFSATTTRSEPSFAEAAIVKDFESCPACEAAPEPVLERLNRELRSEAVERLKQLEQSVALEPIGTDGTERSGVERSGETTGGDGTSRSGGGGLRFQPI
jgi:hypothetical protein